MNNDPLLQPFELKHLRLKNRIFSASHEPSYGENGLPTERYQLYQEEKARGGIGLTMFGGSALVARDCAPAGLEAARVCALRGHRVTLLEAAARPDGQILLAAKVRRRREIIGIIEWLAGEAESAGVDMQLNRFAGAGDVLDLEPDVVIIATGGLPNTACRKAARSW